MDIPEGVVVGFQNLAWALNSQKYYDSNQKKMGTMLYLGAQMGVFSKVTVYRGKG